MVTDEKRCKRYLGEVVEALTGLGRGGSAWPLATLQKTYTGEIEALPDHGLPGFLQPDREEFDLSSIKASVNVQEEKQKSPERLRQTGVALARTYEAGEMEAAKRMLDKSFAAADSKDGYAVVSELIATRHELFDEVRATEVGRLIELAQIKQRRWGDRGRRGSLRWRASRLWSAMTGRRPCLSPSPPNPKWPF